MQNYSLAEFKILTDTPENIQKILNQWKHAYDLEVVQFKVYETSPLAPGLATVIVARQKRVSYNVT